MKDVRYLNENLSQGKKSFRSGKVGETENFSLVTTLVEYNAYKIQPIKLGIGSQSCQILH